MLEDSLSANERWGGVSVLIDDWLNARKELIILYCALTGTNNYHHEPGKNSESLEKQLKQLCELLMDYVSRGHFEIYDQLRREVIEFEDKNENIFKAVEPVFETIQHTTDACLTFNDTCEKEQNICSLHRSLSHLGEILAERFEMEDKLIESMHDRYRSTIVEQKQEKARS